MEKYRNLKRFLSMVLSVSMVVGLMAVVEPREAEAAAGTNLVANGGFDTTDSWDGASAQEKVQETEKNTTVLYETGFESDEETHYLWPTKGTSSIDTTEYAGDSENQSHKHVLESDWGLAEYEHFSMTAGKTYIISYDWKLVDVDDCGAMAYSYIKKSDDILASGPQVTDDTDGWKHVSYEYIPTSNYSDVALFIEVTWGADATKMATVYLDNLSVIECVETPKVQNVKTYSYATGFESGESTHYLQGQGAGVTQEVSNTEYTGDTGTSSNKHVFDSSWSLAEYEHFSMIAGETYAISYDWKVVNLATCGAVAYSHIDAEGILASGPQITNDTNGWQHVSYEYTPTSNQNDVVLYFEVTNGTGNTTMYLDNLSIYYETEEPVMKLTDGIGNCDGTESDNVLMMRELTEVSQDITVSNGKRYKYSFQLKNTATESDFSFGLYAGDTAIDETISGATTVNGWREVSGIFDATADATQISFKRSGVGTVYIDDVEFTEVQKVDMTLSEPAFDGETFSVVNNWSKETLDEIYGVRTAAMVSQGSVWVNNTEKKANYFLEADGTFVLWNLGTNVGTNVMSLATKIEIREGTVITFEGQEAAPIIIQNTVTLEKSASGVWYNPNVTEHTELGGNPLPEGMTNLIEGGDCSGTITNADFVTNTTIVDGMVHINVSGTDDYLQIHSIPVNAGRTYKVSYYIWINGSNSLKYNMYAAGDGANETHEDWLMGTEGSLTTDTNAWQKVEFDWTATGSGTVAFGFKNYDANGSAQIYLDDIVVYDITPELVESSADMTFSGIVNDSQLQFYVPNDAITTLTNTESWPSSTASVVINGTESEVNIYTSNYDANAEVRYFWIHGDAVTAAIATGKIALTGPMVATFDNEKITFNITEGINIEKVGGTWATYTSVHIYPNNNNVSYYNIDNGTTYVLTSSNNAIEVRKNDTVLDVAAGSELNEVGVYDIVRIENNEKFIQQVILYKNGDANVSGKVDIRDLVAIKKQTADQFVSDLNNDGVVNGEDAAAFRYLIIQKNNAAAFVEEKGNSVLNGVMPIAGFDGPTGTLVNDTVFGYMKELGINTLVHDANDISDVTLGTVPMDNLKLAEKYGIGVYVTDGHIRAGGNYLSTAEMVKRVGLYSAYQSFLGVHVIDEPGTPSYKSTSSRLLADYTDGITLFKNYANINGYVNLFPYHTDDQDISETVYNNYLSDAVNAGVDVISYDNYPVGKGKTLVIFTTKKTNYEGFYRNLKLARAKSIDSGKPFWTFAQVGDGFSDENTQNIDTSLLPTAAEMQWEINASLAFGSKGIQYYSVVQPEQYAKNTDGTYDYTRSGLISANGEKNTRYFDAAKSINNYIAAIDEVLMNSENEALIINDENASEYVTGTSEYGEVQSVNGKNALVGCFNYFGKTALLVVNCDVSNQQTITLNFKGAQSVKVIEHDCSTDMSNSQVESLALIIGAGQSALVIVED